MRTLVLSLVLLFVIPVAAQESASYRLTEYAFNAGGHPQAATVMSAANFRVTLDAVGDSMLGPTMSSGSFRMEAGFVAPYPPPGEVLDLLLIDRTILNWSSERSAGTYNLYRGSFNAPLSPLAGSCLEPDIPEISTTDDDQPIVGQTLFYLVTVNNRLDEEGTRGFASDDNERPETNPCP